MSGERSFGVWAPSAGRVEVQVGDRRLALKPQDGGWWRVGTPLAAPGADYMFSLDGGELLPDPRSTWQPEGAEGPSRVLDHGAFRWTDAAWRPGPLSSAVIYELHIGTFSPEGTFDGAAERLGHLTALGITHVELMPVNGFSGERNWGYDGVNLYAPHEGYGGPQGLKRLVDECHRRGLAVILDVVYNHLGPEGNHIEGFGPYLTDRYASPWGRAFNFDGPHSDEVRRFVCDNALMWLRDYHVDALRVDAVHAIFDASAVHILEQLSEEVAALGWELGRHLAVVAESDLNDPRLVRNREAGGYGLDAQWSDDFHHALHAVLTGERTGYYSDFGTLTDLAGALRDVFVYNGRYSPHRRRTHGRPASGLPCHRFLAYMQTHDQVGNRPGGERSARLMSPGRLKAAAALVLTSPCVPLLFQGEEWGASTPFLFFTDFRSAELGRAVREGRRRDLAAQGWAAAGQTPDPQAESSFLGSKLDWTEPARPPHADLLDWHRRLIALRRRMPAPASGRPDRPRVDYDEAAGWILVEHDGLTVICNFSDAVRRVPLRDARERFLLLASGAPVEHEPPTVGVPPEGTVILGGAPPSASGGLHA